MDYSPNGAYLSDQEDLYYHICKWYIANPITPQEEVLCLIEHFTPSWFYSNGYDECACESWLLKKLIYARELSASEIFPRVRTIHFVLLFVPKTIQERLMADD